MSPNEIREIIEGLRNQGIFFPWWQCIFLALSVLFSAYLGSYVKAKGQEKAIKEDFKDLRDRLIQTTKDTEQIKIELSSKNWMTQQHWSRREQHYVGLLEQLAKLRIALEDCTNYFMGPGDDKMPDSPYFKEMLKLSHTSLIGIRERLGPAAIFLSPRAIDALNKLIFDKWHLDNFEISSNFDHFDVATSLTNTAYDIVLEEAKSELQNIEKNEQKNLGSAIT